VTKRVEFEAAHRLMHHEGLCKNLHGHHYVVEASFGSQILDETSGMVADFGVIGARIKEFINTHWDHACILNAEDEELTQFLIEHGMRVFILTGEPTAENMAAFLARHLEWVYGPSYPARLYAVKVWETPTSVAEISANFNGPIYNEAERVQNK